MQGRLAMAAADLMRMRQRNQVTALQIYLKSEAFLKLQSEVDVFLKSSVPPKKKNANPYLLMHFAIALAADDIAKFQAACVLAREFLGAHSKVVLTAKDRMSDFKENKHQRANLLTVMKKHPCAHIAAIEAAAYPGALSDAALPLAGSFDRDDAERAAEIDGTRLVVMPLQRSQSEEKRAIAESKLAAARHGETSPKHGVIRTRRVVQLSLFDLFTLIYNPTKVRNLQAELAAQLNQNSQLLFAVYNASDDVTHQAYAVNDGYTLLTYSAGLNTVRGSSAAKLILKHLESLQEKDRLAILNYEIESKYKNNPYRGCNALAIAVMNTDSALVKKLLALDAVPIFAARYAQRYQEGYTQLLALLTADEVTKVHVGSDAKKRRALPDLSGAPARKKLKPEFLYGKSKAAAETDPKKSEASAVQAPTKQLHHKI